MPLSPQGKSQHMPGLQMDLEQFEHKATVKLRDLAQGKHVNCEEVGGNKYRVLRHAVVQKDWVEAGAINGDKL